MNLANAREQRSTARRTNGLIFPAAWLARRCAAWSLDARADGLIELERALLVVAALAVDAHLDSTSMVEPMRAK
jgi:hypothetical protein